MSKELLAYVNGQYLPQSQASLPIMDRGLLFGDSVYEVIPAYGGIPFRVEHHLRRLDRSLNAIRVRNPLSTEAWHAVFDRLSAQLQGQDQSIYLQVTRGDSPVRNHVIPAGIEPNVVAFTAPLPPRDTARVLQGIRVITLDDIRWHRCDIKATTLLANVMARAKATDEGADEAILVRDGMAMEGTASNLFVVSNGLLITPPDSDELLPGITRDLVLELAADDGIPYAQATIDAAELAHAEEIWLTSSTREVAAVVALNGQQVGDGTPGPLWRRMDALYQACKERLRLGGECRDDG
ncbi:MAG: D-amino acid aminotransferase [Gammaproteobacteria bacterium]|nr:D-amino acid aminotransferase [Gammaproteobacteria bacterium]